MIRCVTKKVFHWIGWKLEGRYPREIEKLILIVAPHTSNWEFPLGMLVKFWLRMDVKYYAKASLFKGPLGFFLRLVGGVPVDRSKNNNLVGQAIQDFKTMDRLHILLTPEGTRKRTEKFKSGFYYIALEAGVPILPVVFDFGEKTIRMLPVISVRGDGASEVEEIRDIYKGVKGKNPADGIF